MKSSIIPTMLLVTLILIIILNLISQINSDDQYQKRQPNQGAKLKQKPSEKSNQFVQPISKINFNTRAKNFLQDLKRNYSVLGEARFDNATKSLHFTQNKDLIYPSSPEVTPTIYNTKIASSWGIITSKNYISSNNFDASIDLKIELSERDESLVPKGIKQPVHYDTNLIVWFISPYDKLDHFIYQNRDEFVGYKSKFKGFGVGLSYRSIRKQFTYYMIPSNKLNDNNGVKINTGIFGAYFHNSCEVSERDGIIRLSLRYFEDNVSLYSVAWSSVHQPCINDFKVELPRNFKVMVSSYNGEFEAMKYKENRLDFYKLSVVNLNKDLSKNVVVSEFVLGDEKKKLNLDNVFFTYEFLSQNKSKSNRDIGYIGNNDYIAILGKTINDLVSVGYKKLGLNDDKQYSIDILNDLYSALYDYIYFLNEYVSVIKNINKFIADVELFSNDITTNIIKLEEIYSGEEYEGFINNTNIINEAGSKKGNEINHVSNTKTNTTSLIEMYDVDIVFELNKISELKKYYYDNETISKLEERVLEYYNVFMSYYNVNTETDNSLDIIKPIFSSPYQITTEIKRLNKLLNSISVANDKDKELVTELFDKRINFYENLKHTLPFINKLNPSLLNKQHNITDSNNTSIYYNESLSIRKGRKKITKLTIIGILNQSELKNLYRPDKIYEMFDDTSVYYHDIAFKELNEKFNKAIIGLIAEETKTDKIFYLLVVIILIAFIIIGTIILKVLLFLGYLCKRNKNKNRVNEDKENRQNNRHDSSDKLEDNSTELKEKTE